MKHTSKHLYMHVYGCAYAHLKARSDYIIHKYFIMVSNCKNEYCNVFVTVNHILPQEQKCGSGQDTYMSLEIAAVRM